MRRPRHNLAFTLMELVIVLMIIALTTALAAPSLRGWSDGAKLRNATDELLAELRWARGQAIIDGKTYALSIDRTQNGYTLSTLDGDALVPAAGEHGQITLMPSRFSIDLAEGGENGVQVRFHPDARTTPAVIRIVSARGEVVDIAAPAPAEPFSVVGRAP